MTTYNKLTPSLAFQLAAPHTWAAAILPVMFSLTYCAIGYSGFINIFFAALLLIICILMQSAVNVFNDYFDFKKGTDSLENSSEDAFDAVLVYNNLNPKSVLGLAIGYLAVAGVLGLYLVFCTSWILLAIGVVGAAVVVLYSGGKTPISYLPIGEFVSGGVMGGLIPLACVYTLTGVLDWAVLFFALPIIIGIAMILATNNTSDIEKDIEAKRSTLSVRLGREKAVATYKSAIAFWLIAIVVIVAVFYTNGLPLLVFMFLGLFPLLRAMSKNPLTQATRDGSMSQIVMLNVIAAAFYCGAILMAGCVVWI